MTHKEMYALACQVLGVGVKTINIQTGLEKLSGKSIICPLISNSGLTVLLTAMLDGMGMQFVSLKGASIEIH